MKTKPHKTKKLTIILISMLVLLFGTVIVFAPAALTKSVEKIPAEDQDKIVDKYNATDFVATNYRWEGKCFYYSLYIGEWQDTHREVLCESKNTTKQSVSDATLDALVTDNIDWTLKQLAVDDVLPNATVIQLPDRKEGFTSPKAILLKDTKTLEEQTLVNNE